MNNPHSHEMTDLLARAARGEFTPSEQRDFEQRLENDAALRESFELEKRLDRALDQMSDFPVSTNFTTLVLQSVRAEPSEGRAPKYGWFRLRFARLATGLAVLGLAGYLTISQYRKAEHQEMVRSVESFTEIASALSPEQKPGLAFQDFDAIERFTLPADSELDLELLAALQK